MIAFECAHNLSRSTEAGVMALLTRSAVMRPISELTLNSPQALGRVQPKYRGPSPAMGYSVTYFDSSTVVRD